MTTASITEFKANVASYLRQVEEGEDVVITNHAQIRPRVISEGGAEIDGVEFVKKVSALRERLAKTLPKDDWKVKDYINHGRR